MEYKRKQITLMHVQSTTAQRRRYREHIIKLAESFVRDKERNARLKSNECPSCYYSDTRIGGAAMTTCNCGACNKEMMFGSTCVDVLCPDCAKKLQLCKHCGADVDYRKRKVVKIDAIKVVQPFYVEPPITTGVFLLPKKEQ